MLDFIIALFGGMAVMIFALAAFSQKQDKRPVRLQPEEMGTNVFTLTRPVLDLLAPVAQLLIWPQYRKWAERKLDAAGLRYSLSVAQFFVLRFVLVLLIWFTSAFLADSLRVVLTAGALFFPELWLLAAIGQRHDDIRRSMPYVVDLLSLCTGAGLEFGVAIDRVIEKADRSPLIDELRQARRDNTLGLPQHEALAEMAKRVQLPELTSFVAIVVQAMKLGASVSDILEAQAEKMRLERYEKAERLGAKAQQKILVPLLLFILPAFVVLGILPMLIDLFRPVLVGGLFGGP